MILERESPLLDLEFPEGSPEALALSKVEPILQRPVFSHTLLTQPHKGGFEELSVRLGRILNQGLLSGKRLGENDREYVYVEVTRHRERFKPTARELASFDADWLCEKSLEGLAYKSREAVFSSLYIRCGVSLLIERDAIEETDKHPDFDLIEGKTFGAIPAEKIKGIVVLSPGEPDDDFSFSLDSEVVRQLRFDAFKKIDEYWQEPSLIFKDLFKDADSNLRSTEWSIDDVYTEEFILRFLQRRHRRIIFQTLEGINSQLSEIQKEVEEIADHPAVHHLVRGLAKSTAALGRAYVWLHYDNNYSDEQAVKRASKFYGLKPKQLSANSLLAEWTNRFTLVMLIKILQRKRNIENLLEQDVGDFFFSKVVSVEERDKLKSLVALSANPIPIYDDFGNLIWPEEKSFQETLDNFMAQRMV